jgi:hypothetical protein
MNKDYFGYYLVGKYKTYSKIDALEYAHLINTPVKWIFNDDVFSTHPWHIDPQIDIKKLYKKRAQQIREKYDYIVIWYSGGVDSWTVTNSFSENNIHVDEIAQFHSYEGEKTWDTCLNKEVKDVAVPQSQEFLNVMPHTKHRTVDLTSIIKSVFDEENNRLDFVYKFNHSWGPHVLARNYVREKVADWAKIIASGKKLCFVWGSDKPPVRYDAINDKHYLEFMDIIDSSSVGPRIQMLNRLEDHDELFYWSPDAMDLMARQAHIIMNYMRNPPKQDLDSIYLTSDPYTYLISYDGEYLPVDRKRAATKINNKMYYLTERGLNRLIYSDWKQDTFTVGKQVSTIFNIKDRWWFDAYKADAQNLFIGAMESYHKKFTKWGFNKFNNDKLTKMVHAHDFRHINIDTCYSKKYYLEI